MVRVVEGCLNGISYLLLLSSLLPGLILQKPNTKKNLTDFLPNYSPNVNWDQTVPVAVFFWVCRPQRSMATLPKRWTGLCTRIRMIQEITMVSWRPKQSFETAKRNHRVKRAYTPDPNVCIDAIGQSRGIPHEFKARDEVASRFESILSMDNNQQKY